MTNTIDKLQEHILGHVEDKFLNENWSLSELANFSFEGMLRRAGDTVHIPIMDKIAWTSGTIADSGADQAEVPFTIGSETFKVEQQASTGALRITNLEEIRTNYSLLTELSDNIVNSLKDKYESHFYDTIVNETAADNKITSYTGILTADNIYEAITEASQKLDANNVPMSDRFIGIDPIVNRLLKLAKLWDNTEVGAEARKKGVIGYIDGAEVRLTNSIGSQCFIVGRKKVANFVRQMQEVQINKASKATAHFLLGDTVYQAGLRGVAPMQFSTVAY